MGKSKQQQVTMTLRAHSHRWRSQTSVLVLDLPVQCQPTLVLKHKHSVCYTIVMDSLCSLIVGEWCHKYAALLPPDEGETPPCSKSQRTIIIIPLKHFLINPYNGTIKEKFGSVIIGSVLIWHFFNLADLDVWCTNMGIKFGTSAELYSMPISLLYNIHDLLWFQHGHVTLVLCLCKQAEVC